MFAGCLLGFYFVKEFAVCDSRQTGEHQKKQVSSETTLVLNIEFKSFDVV